MARLELPDVTLVSVDTVCHDLTTLAIEDCTRHVKFGDVKRFTDMERCEGSIYISSFSTLEEAGAFTAYTLPKYIKTKFALFIHWDSWIIDPAMWCDEFLKYDYIGAPWWYKDGFNVGNSGFHIRSKALMDFLASNGKDFPLTMPEDAVLCRQYQPLLPQFTWAPEELASKFAFERSRPSIESRHFGFHGMFNWPFVLTPERLAERMSLAKANPYVRKTGMLRELDLTWFNLWGHYGSNATIYRG